MRLCLAFICLIASTAGVSAAERREVDLELVHLADSSGSITDDEIAFQRAAYARR
jgi:hypothetical protein